MERGSAPKSEAEKHYSKMRWLAGAAVVTAILGVPLGLLVFGGAAGYEFYQARKSSK